MTKDPHKHISNSNKKKTKKDIDSQIDKAIIKDKLSKNLYDQRDRIYYVKENKKKDKKEIKIFKTDDILNGEEFKEILSDIKNEVNRIRKTDDFIEKQVDRLVNSSDEYIEKLTEKVIRSLIKDRVSSETKKDEKIYNSKSKQTTEKKEQEEIKKKKDLSTDKLKKDDVLSDVEETEPVSKVEDVDISNNRTKDYADIKVEKNLKTDEGRNKRYFDFKEDVKKDSPSKYISDTDKDIEKKKNKKIKEDTKDVQTEETILERISSTPFKSNQELKPVSKIEELSIESDKEDNKELEKKESQPVSKVEDIDISKNQEDIKVGKDLESDKEIDKVYSGPFGSKKDAVKDLKSDKKSSKDPSKQDKTSKTSTKKKSTLDVSKLDEKIIGKKLKEYLVSKSDVSFGTDKKEKMILSDNLKIEKDHEINEKDFSDYIKESQPVSKVEDIDISKNQEDIKVGKDLESDKEIDKVYSGPFGSKKDAVKDSSSESAFKEKDLDFSGFKDDKKSESGFGDIPIGSDEDKGISGFDRDLKKDKSDSDLENKAAFAPIDVSSSDFKLEDVSDGSDKDKTLVDEKIKKDLVSDKKDLDFSGFKDDKKSESGFGDIPIGSDFKLEDVSDGSDKDKTLVDEKIKKDLVSDKKDLDFSGFKDQKKPSSDRLNADEKFIKEKIKEGLEEDKKEDASSEKSKKPRFKVENLPGKDNNEKQIKEEKEKIDQKNEEEKSHSLIGSFKSIFKGKSSKKKSEENVFKIETVKQEKEPLINTNKNSGIEFGIKNLPVSDNSKDKDIIEEKIKANINSKKQNTNTPDIEKKALNLASKHIGKDGKSDNSSNNNLLDSFKLTDSNSFKPPESSLKPAPKSKEIGQEHVFFDEDNSFQGWSPDETKKKDPMMSDEFTTDLKEQMELKEYGEIGNIELPKDALNIDSVKLADLGFSENEWEEIDFYALHDQFIYVEILREKETLEKRYFLVEIELSEEEQKILDFIHETINSIDIETEQLESIGELDYLSKQIRYILKEYDIELNEESFDKILYYFARSSFGFGKIDPLMKDPNIEDISCDGADVPVFIYHRKYGSLKSNIKFESEDELSSFVVRLAQKCNKHISIAEPMIDATMPDGSRVQMTLSDEITAHGSTFTIRKFRADPFSPTDLVEFNTMDSQMVAYMWIAIENGVNILFAGGTASGKTTTLNALSLFIPTESKIVSIEETREINLPHPNWIPGVSRTGFGEAIADKTVGEIDMYDLMKAALRQRPEYILVGEIRGREAYVLFQAMATGHATYSTVHADSAQSLIHRLEGKPINIPRVMLQSLDVVALHIITRVNNKRARRCKQIIEIIDIDPATKEILTNEAFHWDPVADSFVYSGKSYVLERIRADKDLSREEITNELKNRMEVVEYMKNSDIREFKEVTQFISRYLENPQEILDLIKKDDKR